MILTPLKSSNIRAFHYDPATSVMTVEFNGFVRWRYQDCLPYHADAILASESPGRYFATHIKGLKAEKVIDIILVLKAGTPTSEQMEDAADQIEQLRLEVAALTKAAGKGA